MKVSPQKLEALEGDRFDQLPNITFARGLTSAICRAFGVDPAPVLERMPVVVPDLRMPDNQFSQQFQRSGDRPAPLMSKSLVIPLLIVVAVLLIGAVALKLLPIPQIRLPEAAAPAAAPSAPPDGMAADRNAGSAPTEAAASAESAALADGAASAASIGQDEAANEPPAASAGPQETASAPVAAASASDQTAAADDVLAVTTSGDTWITVHDAANKKAPVFSRLVTAGETIHINNGQPPLSVTIGRKDVARVTVRGQPLDLKSLGASSVAHFTVK
jgi:cytoskeleton protein RodZ